MLDALDSHILISFGLLCFSIAWIALKRSTAELARSLEHLNYLASMILKDKEP